MCERRFKVESEQRDDWRQFVTNMTGGGGDIQRVFWQFTVWH